MSAETESQCAAMLKILLAGGSFTSLEAVTMFGSVRAGGRIYDLRQRGYSIDSDPETDGKKHWVRYRLSKGAQLAMAV